MFERFTERARQVVVLAQDEARLLKHNYIGTEHLLLGLLREQEGLAARVLDSLGVDIDDVRAQVGRIVGEGDEVASGQIPFTPRSKRILDLSLREALALGHNYIGTEHLLLGLARENEGVAMRILLDQDLDAEAIRTAVLGMLADAREGDAEAARQWAPSAPIFTAEFTQRIEKLRGEQEASIAAQIPDQAAALRTEEQRLVKAARALERAWAGEPARPRRRVAPRRASSVEIVTRDVASRANVLFGALVAGVGFPLGLLVGWLIWS